jgi:hypothetical protein
MTNITIHGYNDDIIKAKLMNDHIEQIKVAIKPKALTSIDYYPSDYYSEIAIHTDLFDSQNGFNSTKVIEALSTPLYKCEQKLDHVTNYPIFINGNALFITKKRFEIKDLKSNREVILIDQQRAELKDAFYGKGLVNITYWEANMHFSLDFRKDVIDGDYSKIIADLTKLGYIGRFSYIYTADFGNGPESLIVLNVDPK